MEEIAYSYFEYGFGAYLTNLTACIIITAAVMALFRKTLKSKFRNSWTYAIWIIAPLCFLLPFKFETPITRIPLPLLNFALYIKSPEPELAEGITEIQRYNTGAAADGLLLYSVLKWVWLGVFALLLIVELVRYVKLAKDIRKNGTECSSEEYVSLLSEICAELKIKVPRLVIFGNSDTPFAMGIFKPRIILPSENYSAEEIGFILRHEAVHIKRHDIFVKLMLIVFRCMNWFNPFVYIICKQAFEDMEVTCDEKASNGFTDEQRSRYSSAILKGVSRKKYTAVTTYLSSDAKSLKNRISAVMTVKKLGGAIPFVIVFTLISFLSATVYASPDEPNAWYIYTSPYTLEADPYVTTEEWKTCTAYTAEDAAGIIFEQYMDMYMGEKVPEYYRIEEYYINEVDEIDTGFFAQKGFLNKQKFVEVNYNVKLANECGNTVHYNKLGLQPLVNGYSLYNKISYELENEGNRWTLVNYGTAGSSAMWNYHYENELTGKHRTIDTVQCMAECGLLDYSWNTTDRLPDADEYVMCSYLWGAEYTIDWKATFSPTVRFMLKANLNDENFIEEAYNSKYLDENRYFINTESFNFKDVQVVYCGYDLDIISGAMKIYFNVDDEHPHGVMLTFERRILENGERSNTPELVSVDVTDTLYTPYEFADSFLTAELPEGLTEHKTVNSAKAILEYMKTPRDGIDFTVIDYKDITETDDGIYADVKFKGRLEGIYSADILNAVTNYEKKKENRVYGYDESCDVPPEAYDGYMTVCILKNGRNAAV
ncbi:MAG: hypothetical protein IJC04_07815 [Oscillospiraceae bacterium]|nr:hypothetical protein [Oscillospiraceae bacterium]